jgi:L-2-hydroxyglutarate oxidase LhgO
MESQTKDIAIIGAGIVGLGTAMALTGNGSRSSVVILEKEAKPAAHQTGHNSGVIHAGIYYKPGSYKAKLCVEGVRHMIAFCDEQGVRYERCGKVIAATSEQELPRLQALFERGQANGIPGLEMIGVERVREIEPHARAVRGLYSPSTAIVDFAEVARAMCSVLISRGVRIVKEAPVRAIRRAGGLLHLETPSGTISARNVVACAGLHADRVAGLMGLQPSARIIPFRGEYYSLNPGRRLVHGLIYPVPDPEFPFLGVHFTKRIQGDYEAGPNAVLAFAREGYSKTDIKPADVWGMITYRGFWAMAQRYWRTGFYEYYRSLSRQAFLRALQKLVPELQDKDLAPGGSGVRAQAVTPQGTMVDDFLIVEAPNAIHVLNAPSPAATASLAIGRHIAALASKNFQLSN